jgi:CRISPR-associated protein Cas4
MLPLSYINQFAYHNRSNPAAQTSAMLPLSYINQFAYCPRRFWYMYVQGEMVENAHVLRSVLNHEHAHTPGYETVPSGVTVHRRVAVYSHTLGITGYTDLLEEQADGRLVPVEYKQGRQGQWHNDEAQLCVQALCLEEMTGKVIDAGALFYFGSRRRIEVRFTSELRALTRTLIDEMGRVLASERIPPHTQHRQRCRGCSLYDICLPKETERLQNGKMTR